MNEPPLPAGEAFDSYAADYDASLAQGLSVSGERQEYFALGRTRWLAGVLRETAEWPRRVLDFGCGTGSSAPYLLTELRADSVLGVDVSSKSLQRARDLHGELANCSFLHLRSFRPGAEFDLAFCNGVFHHIPEKARANAVQVVFRALRPGGLFAFWENNPWNPGARYVMSRIPFDRDALMLSPSKARQLLIAGGFDIVGTSFLFVFPRPLRLLRSLEPFLAGLPLGAQYQVLCRKPRRPDQPRKPL